MKISEAGFIFRFMNLPSSYHHRRYKDPRLCYRLVARASFCQHWPFQLQGCESEYILFGGHRDHWSLWSESLWRVKRTTWEQYRAHDPSSASESDLVNPDESHGAADEHQRETKKKQGTTCTTIIILMSLLHFVLLLKSMFSFWY